MNGTAQAAALAFCVLVVWFVATMPPGLMWFDAGELALVGQQLGLGHPPGQPFYTLLLALAAELPWVDPLVAMNGLSALCVAACVFPADAILRRSTELGDLPRGIILLTPGALYAVWDQAARIELYGPATLFFLATFAAVLVATERGDGRGYLWPGLWCGLLAGINPVFAVAAGAASALYALPHLVSLGVLRALLASVLGLVSTFPGLATYGYLHWVAGRTDRLVWGELETPAGMLAYLTGADYAHNRAESGTRWLPNLEAWLEWSWSEGMLPLLLIGTLGWLVGAELRRRLIAPALATAMGFGFTLSYGAIYNPSVPDFSGYLLPALWLLPLGIAGWLGALGNTLGAGAAAALLAATGILGAHPVWARTRHDLDMPRELARSWLESTPERGILLLRSDHLVFPTLYVQAVEGVRPDVVVFNMGWGASSWYWRYIYARHPDLPPIELTAPDTPTRVRRLVAAAVERPVRAEDLNIVSWLRIPPCPATWGVAIGAACDRVEEENQPFVHALTGWWQTTAREDAISQRVLAGLARERTQMYWVLGDPLRALEALRAGVPPPPGAPAGTTTQLPLPMDPQPRPRPPLPTGEGRVLIGSVEQNRRMGAAALRSLGDVRRAALWWQD